MNPLGQLKLNLMAQGVVPDDGVRRAFLNGKEGATELKEITFSLTDDFFVSAPIRPATEFNYPLSWLKGRPMLHGLDKPMEVRLQSRPAFLKTHAPPSSVASGNVRLDGYCLNLYLRLDGEKKKLNWNESDVLSLIRAASKEGCFHLVQLNLDYCDLPDRGFSLLEPLVRSIKKNIRTFVALRGFAPETLSGLDRVYASGVDVLVLPLEGFCSAARLEQIMPSEHGHRALEYAAGVFPQGAVLTELIFDPENPGLLFNKIDLLTQKQILPLLILPESGLEAPDHEKFQEGVEHLEQSAARCRLPLKWLFPSARFASALDTRFYSASTETPKLAMKPIYQSAFGKTASEGFAALRRALRVKNISDSYESAGL